jgi:hypothetical protein
MILDQCVWSECIDLQRPLQLGARIMLEGAYRSLR